VSMIMPSFLRSVDASDLALGLPAREKAVGGWQNSAARDFAER